MSPEKAEELIDDAKYSFAESKYCPMSGHICDNKCICLKGKIDNFSSPDYKVIIQCKNVSLHGDK